VFGVITILLIGRHRLPPFCILVHVISRHHSSERIPLQHSPLIITTALRPFAIAMDDMGVNIDVCMRDQCAFQIVSLE